MMRLRAGWLPIGGLALVLISILAFLYARDRGHDTSAYFENTVIVRQLKQLDARWELDVMKSKRVGYTKCLLAKVAYTAEHKRRNQLLYQPTDDDRDDFVTDELERVRA